MLAAFVSAFIYWMHLTAVRIYLPIGAVRILSKATNAITLTAFVLLGLWVLQRNADNRTSRTFFILGVLLIAVSSVFLYQRRESYRTEKKDVVVATVGGLAGHRPVILVAIRNLPYDWIVTMQGEGILPFFERASSSAFFTRLEPFPTSSPKSLWASLATGKLPYRHGVTGRFSYTTPLNRTEPFLLLPNGVGFRAWGLIPPVERISAQLPAGQALPLWSVFTRLQLPVRVVAWPSVRSARLRMPLPEIQQRFGSTGSASGAIVASLAHDLGALDAIQASDDSALTAVALEGFSAAQRALHIFLNDLPQRGSVKGDAVRVYAQQLDHALERVVREHPDHLVVLCSPTAVVPPEIPTNAFAILMRLLESDDLGADDGFVLLLGSPVAHRENPPAARVVDVVPTVLFAAGLPVGRDMDGRILTAAFADDVLRASTLSAIQTYEAERVVVRQTDTGSLP